MVGAYGLGEVLSRMEQRSASVNLSPMSEIRTKLPSLLRGVRGAARALIRGSVVGFLIGVIPGAGATIASFVSYGLESQYGKRRRELGTGIPEGIVAPQIGRHRLGRRRHGAAADHGHPGLRRHRHHHGRLHAARHPARPARVLQVGRPRLRGLRGGVRRRDRHVPHRLLRHQAAGQGARRSRRPSPRPSSSCSASWAPWPRARRPATSG